MSDKLQEAKDELGYCIEQADEPEAQPLKRILALLLAVEQEQVCPKCSGKERGAPAKDGGWITCSACDGKGDYRSWAGKQIADLTEQKNTLEQGFDQAAKTVVESLKTIAGLQAENERLKKGICKDDCEYLEADKKIINQQIDKNVVFEKQLQAQDKIIADLQTKLDAAVEALKATSASLPERSLMKEKIEVALGKINSEKKEGGK